MNNTTSETTYTAAEAKSKLKELGWTQQDAARQLGRTYQHLNWVLNGSRISRSLIKRVMELPPCTEPRKKIGRPRGSKNRKRT